MSTGDHVPWFHACRLGDTMGGPVRYDRPESDGIVPAEDEGGRNLHMSEIERGPAEAFAAIVAAFRDEPGVTPPDSTGAGKRFGSDALKVHDKIFAMHVGDRLVVKLSRQRVDDLIARGHGARFVSGQGRPMKEWFSVGPPGMPDALDLAREALAFVAAGR